MIKSMIIVVTGQYLRGKHAFTQYACARFLPKLDAGQHDGFLNLSHLKEKVNGENLYYKIEVQRNKISARLYQPVKIWHPPTKAYDLVQVDIIEGAIVAPAPMPTPSASTAGYQRKWTTRVREYMKAIENHTVHSSTYLKEFQKCVAYLLHTSGMVHANPEFGNLCKRSLIDVYLEHSVEFVESAFLELFEQDLKNDPDYQNALSQRKAEEIAQADKVHHPIHVTEPFGEDHVSDIQKEKKKDGPSKSTQWELVEEDDGENWCEVPDLQAIH